MDHRVLDRRQERAGMFRVEAPRTPYERIRWITAGTLDAIDRVRTRDDEMDVELSRIRSVMARFFDMAFGILDLPVLGSTRMAQDPIVRTPRTFRGSRPKPKPEWRAKKEPPARNDLIRFKTLIKLMHGVTRDDLRGGIGVAAIFAILVALMTWLIARGRAARTVQRCVGIVIVVGLVTLGVGLWASVKHQPLVVVVSLAVAGAILTGTGLLARRPITRRYTEIELRRMRAMDAGSGASASPPLPLDRSTAGA